MELFNLIFLIFAQSESGSFRPCVASPDSFALGRFVLVLGVGVALIRILFKLILME